MYASRRTLHALLAGIRMVSRGRHIGRCLKIGTVAMLVASGSGAESLAAAADKRGGSNYAWSSLEACRPVHDVIMEYDKQKSVVDQQLSAMYANGQRRLAINIFFAHNGAGGNLDSTGGDVNRQYKENLTAYLNTLRTIGFEEVLIEFLPQGASAVWQNGEWPVWHEDMYQEHWSLIRKLRPIFAASGVRYRFDLYGEAIPVAGQVTGMRYVQTLWRDYTKAFGKKDTVGFSIIPVINQDRFAQMPRVYHGDPPQVLSLHFHEDAYRAFVNAYRRLRQLGYAKIPWIIGEALYDDGKEADELARAIKETGQKVSYLLQWPLTRADPSRCHDVDVPFPLQFDQYIRRGF